MRRITVRSPGRVLVSPTDFGWGSIGKLWLILDKLHDRDVVMNEVSNTAELVSQVLGGRRRLDVEPGAPGATVALVINDP